MNEELHDLYPSLNTTEQTRSRYITWVDHTWQKQNVYRIVVEKPEKRRHLEASDIDERIKFKQN